MLEHDCQERIEEGLAAIVIGIIYPLDLRKNWNLIEESLRKSALNIRVFSENGSGEWFDSDLNGLSRVLRTTYESLVNEDVLNAAVDELRQSIETTSLDLCSSRGAEGRLRKLLVLQYREGETEGCQIAIKEYSE
jgi:hypothetical protein